MGRKHFLTLAAVTVAVLLVVLLTPSRTGREDMPESDMLVPELDSYINDVNRVVVESAGGEIDATLLRSDDGWVLEESAGYPADWDTLRGVLSELAQARVVELKTSNPEYYARLGVEDPAGEEATGKRIRLIAGDRETAVIIGKRARGRDGQYVRVDGQAVSALIDRQLDLPRDRMSWLQRDIVDVSDERVLEASIVHPDGEVVTVSRESPDQTDFTLQEIPEGREVQSTWSVNSVAGGLARLTLDDAASQADFDWSSAVRFQLRTADGLTVEADLIEREDERWMRVQATGVGEESEALAFEINGRTAGWAYQIPLYKYDSLAKRTEDLLKEVESEDDEVAESG